MASRITPQKGEVTALLGQMGRRQNRVRNETIEKKNHHHEDHTDANARSDETHEAGCGKCHSSGAGCRGVDSQKVQQNGLRQRADETIEKRVGHVEAQNPGREETNHPRHTGGAGRGF